MNEEERKAIVESGPVYLQDGLRAGFAGWSDPLMCGVHSARPGFWVCTWETAKRVSEAPNRRFTWQDNIFRSGYGWLGYTPDEKEYQTPEDYEAATARGEKPTLC